MTMRKKRECNHRDSKGHIGLICDNCSDYSENCNCDDCGAVCPMCGEFLGKTCYEIIEEMDEQQSSVLKDSNDNKQSGRVDENGNE